MFKRIVTGCFTEPRRKSSSQHGAQRWPQAWITAVRRDICVAFSRIPGDDAIVIVRYLSGSPPADCRWKHTIRKPLR